MAVKLHRCPFMWMKGDWHPCHRVQKALDEQGIEYEVVKEPGRRGKREFVIEKTGQPLLPVIEFEDGSVYRAEAKEMAARIRAGELRPDEASSQA